MKIYLQTGATIVSVEDDDITSFATMEDAKIYALDALDELLKREQELFDTN